MDQLAGQLFSVLPGWTIYIILYGFAVYLTYYCSAIAVAYQNADCEYGWIPNWKTRVSKNHMLSRTLTFMVSSIKSFLVLIIILSAYIKFAGIDIRTQTDTLSIIHNISGVIQLIFCLLMSTTLVMFFLAKYDKSKRAKTHLVNGVKLNLESKVSSMTSWIGFAHPVLIMVMLDISYKTAPQSNDFAFLFIFIFPLILVVFDVWVEKELRNFVTEVKVLLEDKDYIYIGEDANTVFLKDPERPDVVIRKNISTVGVMTFSKEGLLLKEE